MTRDWAASHGFTLFPETGYESVTLTCINNGAREGGRTVDVPQLQTMVKEQGIPFRNAYRQAYDELEKYRVDMQENLA